MDFRSFCISFLIVTFFCCSNEDVLKYHFYIENEKDVFFRTQEDLEFVRYNIKEQANSTIPSPNMDDLMRLNKQFELVKDKCVYGRDVFEGRFALVEEVPYQVNVRRRALGMRKFKSHCGGALITPDYVITAADCLDTTGRYEYRVVAGAESSEEVAREIRCYYTHKYFVRNSVSPDIAIIEVDSPFPLSQSIYPIRMHTGDLQLVIGPQTHTFCLLSGFGDARNKETFGLRIACAPVLPFRLCTSFYPVRRLPPNTMCAGDVNGTGGGICHADPGGPLVCLGALVGIAAQGFRCGADPGVFMRVSAYTKRFRNISFFDDESPKEVKLTTNTSIAENIVPSKFVLALNYLVLNLL